MSELERRASMVTRWVYKRKEGDIEIYAANLEEVLDTLACHGFKNVDGLKISNYPKNLLCDILMSEKEERT